MKTAWSSIIVISIFVLIACGCIGSDKQTSIKKENNSADWGENGAVLYSEGKYDDALKALDKAIELDPKNKLAWRDKGLTLYSQCKYDDALKAFDTAIEINPKDAYSWAYKGITLTALGRDTDAEAAITEAKELGLKNPFNIAPTTNEPKIKPKIRLAISYSSGFNSDKTPPTDLENYLRSELDSKGFDIVENNLSDKAATLEITYNLLAKPYHIANDPSSPVIRGCVINCDVVLKNQSGDITFEKYISAESRPSYTVGAADEKELQSVLNDPSSLKIMEMAWLDDTFNKFKEIASPILESALDKYKKSRIK